MKLKDLRFLEVALEDLHLGLGYASRPQLGINRRLAVLLFEEAAEFLAYQKISLLGLDIYKGNVSVQARDRGAVAASGGVR